MPKEFKGSAKLTAYIRENGVEVYTDKYTALARVVRGVHTMAAYWPGNTYAEVGGHPYSVFSWRVTGDVDPGLLIDDTVLDVINQEDADLNFYVEYLTVDGTPYNNNNLDGRTFGPGKMVVFSAASFLKLPA